jgi:hypothetical protein
MQNGFIYAVFSQNKKEVRRWEGHEPSGAEDKKDMEDAQK